MRIRATPPDWNAPPNVRSGAPALHVASALEGPGELIVATVAGAIALPARGLVLRCSPDDQTSYVNGGEVSLPPHATSTLVTTWRRSSQPLLPFTDLRPRLEAQVGGGPAQPLSLERPRIEGPTGVGIRLLDVRRPVWAGRQLRLRGRTDPALAGQMIVLRRFGPVSHRDRVTVPGLGRFESMARVRVDSLGRFEYRWRPRRGGLYGVYPSFRGETDRILRDHGCPILVGAR